MYLSYSSRARARGTVPLYTFRVLCVFGRRAAVLKEEWGPTRNVRWIMGVLYNMFLTEGAGHGVDADIMKLKEENYEAFKAKVAAQIAELNE